MKWRWRLTLGCVAVLLFVFLLTLPQSGKQPSYGGKSLQDWSALLLRALQDDYPMSPNDLEASRKAIRAIGTNALPFYLADVQAPPGGKDRVFGWLRRFRLFQRLGAPTAVDHWTIEGRWNRGVRGLEVLGPLAKPCLPELIALATNNVVCGPRALVAVGADALPAVTNLMARNPSVSGPLMRSLADAVNESRIVPEDAVMALPELVRAFQSANYLHRHYAAAALGAIHREPEVCIPLLLAGCADTNLLVRQTSAQALGGYGDTASPFAAKLAAVFDTADAITRRSICHILPKMRSAGSVMIAMLDRGLAAPDPRVRAGTVEALGQIAILSERAAADLAEAMGHTNALGRARAIESLGIWGPLPHHAVASLKRACADPDEEVRMRAGVGLQGIASSYGQYLGTFGDEAGLAVGRLAEIFDAVDAATRRGICGTLPMFPAAGGAAISLLNHALEDPDKSVRLLAVHGLGVLGSRRDEAVPALARAIQGSDPRFRLQTPQAFENLGSHAASAVAALQRACGDGDDGVRRAATNALRRIQSDSGLGAVRVSK